MSEIKVCLKCGEPAEGMQRDRIYKAVLAVLEYVPPGETKDELVDALLELGSVPVEL